MNRWQEQLTNHPIHSTLSEARGYIEAEHENTSSELEVEKRRLLKLFDYIETVLEQVDPEIVPFNLLDNLNNGIRHQNIWNQLTAYSSNGDLGHLTNANNNFSAQLPIVMQLATFSKEPALTKQLKTIEKSADAFTKSIGEQQKALTDEVSATEAKRSELEQRLEQLSTAVDAKKAEAEQLTAAWQKEFTAAQIERKTEFETWRKETSIDLEGRVEKLIEANSVKLQTTNQDFVKKIEGFLTEAEEKHQNILDLHEIVAGDSVAAGYLQNAQDEKWQANFWRWASIIFIVATAVWAGFSYFKAPGADTVSLGYWGQALKAFSVAGVLLFGAVYSSKQSNLHRKNEQRTRWLALEVKAIDPFIASLAPDDQKELKKNLSEKLFGQMNNLEDSSEHAINDHMLTTITKAMSDIIKASKS